MNIWTQVDFILAFPLGAMLAGLVCVFLGVIIGIRMVHRDLEAAHKGWRDAYHAWTIAKARNDELLAEELVEDATEQRTAH